jgi:hypothetical protein
MPPLIRRSQPRPGRMAGWILDCAAGFYPVTGSSRGLFRRGAGACGGRGRLALSAPHEATASAAVARLAQDAAAADAAAWIVADNADRPPRRRRDGRAIGPVTGAGTSIVFVLASLVRMPLAELAISNRLFRGLAGW